MELRGALIRLSDGRDSRGPLDRTTRARLERRRFALSYRELEVLRHAALGLSIQETGRELFLSQQTIKSYRKGAIRKLHARNTTHAVAIAYEQELLAAAGPTSLAPGPGVHVSI